MTLVLLIGSADYAVTVADRRLTSGLEVVNDDSNKLAVLITRGARVAVGFSGLAADRRLSYQPAKLPPDLPPLSAYVGLPGSASFRTGAWLPDTLADEAHTAGYELAPLVRRFAGRLAERVASLQLPDDQRRLIVVFAGFVYEESEHGIGSRHVIYTLSNLDPSRSPEVIESSTGEPADLFYALAYGTVQGIPPSRVARLLQMAEANDSPDAIVTECVATARDAARSPASRNAVGESCSSVVIPREPDPDHPAIGRYHRTGDPDRLYFPSCVVATEEPARVVLDPHFTPDPSQYQPRSE